MTLPGDGAFTPILRYGQARTRSLRPSVARIHDFFLGGTHYLKIDQIAARLALHHMPDLPGILLADRAFLGRAVRHLMTMGIRQFLDLGSGIPTMGHVHEVAQSVDPTIRVVYTDTDPAAVSIAETILAGEPCVAMIRADLRDPETIMRDPTVTRLLDVAQPLGLLMVGVLHLVGDDEDPGSLLDRWAGVVAPGSFLAMSHMSPIERQSPPGMEPAKNIHGRSGQILHPRGIDALESIMRSWQIQPPGLVPFPLWRPDPDTEPPSPDVIFPGLGGLARKPVPPQQPRTSLPRPGSGTHAPRFLVG